MFKMVTRILGVIALTGWMGAANATLIFDFSWDSDNGEIIGEIYGLSDNGESMAATGIVLTSIDGMQVNINVMDVPSWIVEYNDFDVSDGFITNFDFLSSHSDIYGQETMSFDIFSEEGYVIYEDGVDDYYAEKFAFVNRVTVPEPSSVILMLLGLAGLSFARYRKQS
jgi:hypothetical protein